MHYIFDLPDQDEPKIVQLEGNNNIYTVTVGDNTYQVILRPGQEGVRHLTVAGQQTKAVVAQQKKQFYVALEGQTYTLEQIEGRRTKRRHSDEEAGSQIEASMTGTVLSVEVSPGDTVEKGQTLVILEAMKMELRLAAPRAGTIQKITCQAGELVQQGQILVELEK